MLEDKLQYRSFFILFFFMLRSNAAAQISSFWSSLTKGIETEMTSCIKLYVHEQNLNLEVMSFIFYWESTNGD